MSRIPAKQITAWSFSRYSDYKLCPLKARLKYIDKIKEPPNKAMARGAEIHDKIAEYINNQRRRLPTGLHVRAQERIKALRKRNRNDPVRVEEMWGFDAKWQSCAWDDWENCQLRVKIDAATIDSDDDKPCASVIDWKTGKFRPNQQDEYEEQLSLYALAMIQKWPKLQRIHVGLVYVDTGDEHWLEYTANQARSLRKEWDKKARAMLRAKSFPPRPNWSCQWCYFRAANKSEGGGQCKY